jgi:D-serine deaminase-like pyridoxal phosphate-dependent protein
MSELLAVAGRFPLDAYRVADPEQLLTPNLLIYEAAVNANIATTLALLGGRPERWRPHVKTAKLAWAMGRFLTSGIAQFKCATTGELETLCALGATDVLLAFPAVGANARRVCELAAAHPDTQVSVLVDHPAQLHAWRGSAVCCFLDLNPGMDRTGAAADAEVVRDLARAACNEGVPIAGLHWYDGHISGVPQAERAAVTHRGYDRLVRLVASLEASGVRIPEVITAGTPAFPHALTYPGFAGASFVHRVSPGTVVYGDLSLLSTLPAEWGYRPAALVLAAVVSHPRPGRITCDAGHKSVSADAGVPTCGVLGYPAWAPAGPSEEHLPIDLPQGELPPPIGSYLYLLPRHICPTVNNFDRAALIVAGRVARVEAVSARGHEGPRHVSLF